MSECQVMFQKTRLTILIWAAATYSYACACGISAVALAQAASLTNDDIRKQNMASLVLLKTSGVLRASDGKCDARGGDAPETPGVGFFVSSGGHILTARHVVRRDEEWLCDDAGRPTGRRVHVWEFNERNQKAQELTPETRNVRTSPYADIALVKVQSSGRDLVDAINTCEPTGDVVALVWRKQTTAPVALSGVIQPNAEEYTGGLVKFDVSVGQIQRGDSGSPIFNRSGQLVGILQGMGEDDRIGFFVPIADAASLLFNVFDIKTCSARDRLIAAGVELIPTITLRFSGEGMRKVAAEIAETLRTRTGYTVGDPAVFDTWGKDYEVRYFDPKDREMAEHVAKLTEEIITDLGSSGQLSGSRQEVRVIDKADFRPAPPYKLELWLALTDP